MAIDGQTSFSLDEATGELKTQIAETVVSTAEFFVLVHADVYINSAIYAFKVIFVTINAVNECEDATFDVTEESVTVSHDLFDPEPITTDLANFGNLNNPACQQYVKYSLEEPSEKNSRIAPLDIDRTGLFTSELVPEDITSDTFLAAKVLIAV